MAIVAFYHQTIQAGGLENRQVFQEMMEVKKDSCGGAG